MIDSPKFSLNLQSEVKPIFWTKQIYLIDFSIMVISDYYYQVLKSNAERASFRSVVLSRTGMSYSSFYAKLATDTFKLAEREVLNSIIKEWKDA